MSADWAVNVNGLDIQSNTRSIGNGMFAMLKAYEVFGDKKYLDRAQWIVDCVQAWQDGDVERLKTFNRRVVWDPQFKGGYSHQSWMYGIALEGMAQASQATGRSEMPAYLRRAVGLDLRQSARMGPRAAHIPERPDPFRDAHARPRLHRRDQRRAKVLGHRRWRASAGRPRRAHLPTG